MTVLSPAPDCFFVDCSLFVFACAPMSALWGWRLLSRRSLLCRFCRPAQPPKSETEKIEAQRDGTTKISYDGVAADGSAIAFSFTNKYDGADSPVSGAGPNGQDTIAAKRIDAYTVTSISKKADVVVATARTVISKDGKVMTLTSNGVDAQRGRALRVGIIIGDQTETYPICLTISGKQLRPLRNRPCLRRPW